MKTATETTTIEENEAPHRDHNSEQEDAIINNCLCFGSFDATFLNCKTIHLIEKSSNINLLWLSFWVVHFSESFGDVDSCWFLWFLCVVLFGEGLSNVDGLDSVHLIEDISNVGLPADWLRAEFTIATKSQNSKCNDCDQVKA